MTLGAVSLGGAYFFVQAFRATQWHTVKAGFVAVGTFATLLGVLSLLPGGPSTCGRGRSPR